MRSIIIALAASLLVTASAAAQDAAPANAPDSTPAAAPAPDNAAPPAPTNPEMIGPQLLISTSMGDITLQLDAVKAPKSVANVLRYVREKHYDGTVFYRVAKGFVIQMGSWDANVKGRPGHPPIVFEGANGLSNLRGTVALAHAEDPNSATADFFINVSDNTGLNHVEGNPDKIGYTVFGQVTSGMDVADAISIVPVGDHGPMPGQAPVDPILIKKVSLLPSEVWHAQCAAGTIPVSSCEAAMGIAPAGRKGATKQPDSKSRPSDR
jgi:cyclophilin family peptidyl-prolyl cis-trans isomerase